MKTNILGYILATPGRQKIVKTLLAYPARQWSCSDLEEVAKLPHATVFRTLRDLRELRLLTGSKVNKKDLVYMLVRPSRFIPEIKRLLHLGERNAKSIARELSRSIASPYTRAIILYGSSIKGTMRYDSDIDVLIVVPKHDREKEMTIYDKSTALAIKYNVILSPLIMDSQEIKKEKQGYFLRSVKENMEVLHGKAPF